MNFTCFTQTLHFGSDEDFAVKAPASKKARLEADKSKKPTVKSASQESGPLIHDRKER